MPEWFDRPTSRTVAEEAAKQVNLLTAGSEHLQFMVTFACTADRKKLVSFIIFIFKGMTLLKGEIPCVTASSELTKKAL